MVKQRQPAAEGVEVHHTGDGPTLAVREARFAYLLLAPGVLIVLALVLLPVLWNVTLSLRQIRLIELRNFNPLEFDLTVANFRTVVGTRGFLGLLRNTLLYAVLGTTLSLVGGLWAALVVRKPFPGRALVRGLILFPYVVPVVAAALLWRTMLNPQLGILNAWMDALLGTGPVNLLTQRSFEVSLFGTTVGLPAAFTMIVLFEAWRSFPFAFLFILARLQALPSDLEEAARVDGASAVQSFIFITLPQLKAVFAVLFLLRFIWTFNAFDEIFLLTGGAAGTNVVSVEIYGWLFGRSNVGAAAALSIVLAFVLAVFLFIYFRWFYSEEEA
jgi:multiple sugar transport system permease protein